MIIDTFDNINFYFGMSQELDAALSVLKHFNLKSLQPGEYADFPVSGSNVILKVLEAGTTIDADSIPWECHKSTIDVQYVLSGGCEIIGYTPRNKLTGWEYDEKHDVAYSHDHSDYLPIRLEEGDFAIFFPQDAHRKVQSFGVDSYHKIVLKVPINGFKFSKFKYVL